MEINLSHTFLINFFRDIILLVFGWDLVQSPWLAERVRFLGPCALSLWCNFSGVLGSLNNFGRHLLPRGNFLWSTLSPFDLVHCLLVHILTGDMLICNFKFNGRYMLVLKLLYWPSLTKWFTNIGCLATSRGLTVVGVSEMKWKCFWCI